MTYENLIRSYLYALLRERLDLDQGDVARCLGISQASVSRMLSPNGRPIRIAELQHIVSLLGMELEIHIGGHRIVGRKY